MRILQIIPADNWRAQYSAESGALDDVLICWALVDGEGEDFIGQEVRGMVADGSMITFADEIKEFVGYRYV